MALQHRHPPRRLERLLLATDFSPGARRVERRLLLLPLAEAARLDLLHVVDGALDGRARRAAVEAAERDLARVADRLRRLGRHLGEPPPEIAAAVAVGAPHVEIIRRARADEAELVVMGRHGAGGLRARVLGTTAARVVRYGDTPVLVVKTRATGPYRRPMVAVDLEDASAAPAVLAARLSGPDAGPLCLVHACAPPRGTAVLDAVAPARERAEERRRQGRRAAEGMAALVAILRERLPGVAARQLVFHGQPAGILAREAVRAGADLLAVGTHGRTGVAHALLGSVAERILDQARCDVIVARPARFTFLLP